MFRISVPSGAPKSKSERLSVYFNERQVERLTGAGFETVDETVCYLESPKQVILAYGLARRNPTDPMDKMMGKRVSFGKALRQLLPSKSKWTRIERAKLMAQFERASMPITATVTLTESAARFGPTTSSMITAGASAVTRASEYMTPTGLGSPR